MKKRINWKAIDEFLFDALHKVVIYGFIVWVVWSVVEVPLFRNVAGYDFSRNFIHIMMNLIGG